MSSARDMRRGNGGRIGVDCGEEIYHDAHDIETSKRTGDKYNRVIKNITGDHIVVDVYDVIEAYKVTCPALQHLLKKALCTGLRGHKDGATDLVEIRDAAERAIQLNANRS